MQSALIFAFFSLARPRRRTLDDVGERTFPPLNPMDLHLQPAHRDSPYL